MTSYTAPIRDIRFAMDALGLLPALAELPGYTDGRSGQAGGGFVSTS